MPSGINIHRLLFPKELIIKKYCKFGGSHLLVHCSKEKNIEYCPKCANPSKRVHDYRTVKIKDEPIRGTAVTLLIKKRRLWCKTCGTPFTEPIHKISKGHRTTANYKRGLFWAASVFKDFKTVKKTYKCSYNTLYKAAFWHFKKRIKDKLSYPLPSILGIDEHSIRKIKHAPVDYATVFVDHKNKRAYDLCEGRSLASLSEFVQKNRWRGFKNVKVVTIDLSETYRSFVKRTFPKANIVVDRFHLQRLIGRAVNKLRLRIRGDIRKDPVRHLTLRNASSLKHFEKRVLKKFLNIPVNIDLKLAYEIKESIRNFYNVKGFKRARKILIKVTQKCDESKVPLLTSFRKTLLKWFNEILNYHRFNRVSNGRVEGFNRKAKLIQRRAYGYKNFSNYRIAFLHACI